MSDAVPAFIIGVAITLLAGFGFVLLMESYGKYEVDKAFACIKHTENMSYCYDSIQN